MNNTSELERKILELRLENEMLKREKEKRELKKVKKVSLGTSEKGGVKIMGIRRFPITLYKTELEKILELQEEIFNYIRENDLK